MNKQYQKININLEEFRVDASSGVYTAKELALKYNLIRNNSARKIYYIANKYNIQLNLKRDAAFRTNAYKQKISNKLLGIRRTEDQLKNYRAAAKRRGNNRPIGTYTHNELTKKKISESNRDTYKVLPNTWKDKTLNNPEWFKKLRKVDYNKLDSWQKYCYDVRLLSYRNARKYVNLIEGKKQCGYHLDHMLSISEAFNNNLEVEIVSSYHNLRYIPAAENLQKNVKSIITLEQLKEKYYDTKIE